MPTITLNKEIVEKLIGKKLSIEKLKDRISYLGTDLESIEGNEITVEIFPNRPDLLSEQGFARALSSFIGGKTGLKQYNVQKSNEKVIIDKSVAKIRPYTACAIVKNLKFDQEGIKEIIKIQEKLHITYCRNRKKAAIGIYPYEKIKAPIRYLALKPEEIKFQPLESDKKLTAQQILEKHPAGKEYGYLLDGLDKYPVFIDSNNEILSMPPIINSYLTGKITQNTKDVFIECSGFDFNVLKQLLSIIVTALADMGGKIYSMQLQYPDEKIETPNLEPKEVDLNLDYVNKILGLKLNEKEIATLLARMGFSYKNKKVLIPCYRNDILHEIDLAEDIAIAYGYENFKPEIPNIFTIASENEFEIFKKKVASILVGLGLNEVSTYHITNKEDQCAKMQNNIELIELKNALTQEYDNLRAWIIPNLLKVLKDNKHHEYPQKIFDIGTIFKINPSTETNVEENTIVAAAICHKTANYTEIRQALDSLLNALNVEYKVLEDEHPSFIQGRVAKIVVNNNKVAYLGELNPAVISNWKIGMPVSAFELNLIGLYEIIKG